MTARRPTPRVDRALRRVARGETPYSAARAERIALSTIYRALKRLRQTQPVREP